MNSVMLRTFLTRIGSKPRYIPPKPEFLKYADIDYYEETAATLLMEQYLRRDRD